jgi:hypothetical protein
LVTGGSYFGSAVVTRVLVVVVSHALKMRARPARKKREK